MSKSKDISSAIFRGCLYANISLEVAFDSIAYCALPYESLRHDPELSFKGLGDTGTQKRRATVYSLSETATIRTY